jgi:hypothetical protein
MRFNYQPGKSQMILMTTVLGSGTPGITKRVGILDDNNGLFFELAGSSLRVVKRSLVGGSPSDAAVGQADWNMDKLDGTGKSGIIIDPSKVQILFIDYEWLGVGRVRMGFVVNGRIIYCHVFNHTNIATNVYMSTPNLPLRYEISNDGTGGATNLRQICSMVSSEGGVQKNGLIFSANTGTQPINANTIGSSYAMIGLKLKSTHLGTTIEMVRLSVLGATGGDNCIWELLLNPTVAGTFNYNSPGTMAVEVAIGNTTGNPSTNTVTGGTLIDSGVVRENTASIVHLENALKLGATIAGVRDSMVLAIKPLTANSDFHASLTWRELT